MDRFRQPQPMEGFSRPGSLGGEAHDDDSVEGHMMDDDKITEGGPSGFRATDEDDTEGHGGTYKRASDEDDVEGHVAGLNRRLSDDDDSNEGTGTNFR